MRCLLHCPMIHFSDTRNIRKLLELLKINKSINKRFGLDDISIDGAIDKLQFILDTGKKSVDEKWNEFQTYLLTQPPFDRIYKEGVTKRTTSFKVKSKEKSGMKDCIDYLIATGATFETTESFLWLTSLIFFPFFKSTNFLHRKRESAVYNNITRTLKEGERGLLLFGRAHDFERFFKNSDIQYEIYDYSIPIIDGRN